MNQRERQEIRYIRKRDDGAYAPGTGRDVHILGTSYFGVEWSSTNRKVHRRKAHQALNCLLFAFFVVACSADLSGPDVNERHECRVTTQYAEVWETVETCGPDYEAMETLREQCEAATDGACFVDCKLLRRPCVQP